MTSILPELKEFDLSQLRKHDFVSITVIGKRGSGKSILIKNLLYELSNNHHLFLSYSGTESVNHFYGDFLPKICSFDGEDLTKERMAALAKRQKRIKRRIDAGVPGFRKDDERSCLIIDDMIYTKEWMKIPDVKAFVTNGRHFGQSIIVATQEVKGLLPFFRTNADYVFCSQVGNADEYKKIKEEIFSAIVRDKKDIDRLFEKYTSGFRFLVVDNRTQEPGIDKKIFWFRGNPNIKGQVGNKIYYDINDTYERLVAKQLRNTKQPDEQKKDEPTPRTGLVPLDTY